ncbi:hypothetical protein UA38_11805 [Photobacterium kishitanii]|uniref:Uncharacterized protein n=1 Tax=Photobacterium kishitanii TaxID=318456 RepID=A0AAX0YW97_9GAMM|nr:hypothetical protein [Photobacterium kishitanii]KJG57053.1 hypothetical protein UA38_11805 [Photobacterium kishitanii]KJG60578.1 hypothetical protein UA42_14595 [Photobacterium kishitanii]KJG64880.1 hypothetical protein UA40_14290 [Photobacterium kishitanii]KJG68516.1 hypothetical protein UA41_16700 [Photobacterium kishitanii]PSX18329.1 hypothetical protein C0W70_15790 [Photobacterium kishitanii]
MNIKQLNILMIIDEQQESGLIDMNKANSLYLRVTMLDLNDPNSNDALNIIFDEIFDDGIQSHKLNLLERICVFFNPFSMKDCKFSTSSIND